MCKSILLLFLYRLAIKCEAPFHSSCSNAQSNGAISPKILNVIYSHVKPTIMLHLNERIEGIAVVSITL